METIVHSYSEKDGADATINGERWSGIKPGSRFWADVQAWKDAGNEWPEPPAPDPEAVKAAYSAAIQTVVDTAPAERLFRDGVTLASYVASTNPQWAAEAQTFVAWRDQVWAYSYTELEKVLTGQRPQPTIEEFIAELPVIQWPAS